MFIAYIWKSLGNTVDTLGNQHKLCWCLPLLPASLLLSLSLPFLPLSPSSLSLLSLSPLSLPPSLLTSSSTLSVKHQVTAGGKAQKGGVNKGDYVISINGDLTDGLLHFDAQQMIKATGMSLQLTVSG